MQLHFGIQSLKTLYHPSYTVLVNSQCWYIILYLEFCGEDNIQKFNASISKEDSSTHVVKNKLANNPMKPKI